MIIQTTRLKNTKVKSTVKWDDADFMGSAFASWIKDAILNTQLTRLVATFGPITYTFERKPQQRDDRGEFVKKDGA